MEEKGVLYISYYFPPMRHIASVRAAKFAKYLSLYGWRSYVLTASMGHGWTQAQLQQAYGGIDHQRVYRVPSPLEPSKLAARISGHGDILSPTGTKAYGIPYPPLIKRASRWFREWLMIPDEQITWLPMAIAVGQKIIREHHIDAMITSSGPYSVHLIGYWLRRKYHIPWLADFRDSWTQNSDVIFATDFHKRIHQALEQKVFEGADCVTAVEPGVYVGSDNSILQKIQHLTNGFDPEDFLHIQRKPAAGIFSIVFAGSFYSAISPNNFIEALANVLRNHCELRSKIRVRFYGRSYAVDIRQLVNRYGIEDVLRLEGDVPRQEVLQELVNADALLLIRSSQQLTVYSGKLFEYLGARRPILGLVPVNGVAANVIRQTEAGVIAPPDDIPAIERAILDLYERWEKGTLEDFSPRRTEEYSYPRLASNLASYLNQMVAPKQRRD